MRSLNHLPLSICICFTPAVISAQKIDEVSASSDTQNSEIVVFATRLRGELDTNVPPIGELDETEVQATGATSLTELVAAVAPQAGSGRGRGSGQPVFLVNGQRISGFREIRDLSPDAIKKMQIFPEEVAVKYGFRPDQRVINFILKDNFAVFAVDGEYQVPDRGGQQRAEVETTFQRIGQSYRLNLTSTFETSSGITEDERGVTSAAPLLPLSITGNISGLGTGGEISPSLSTIAGQMVTVAAIPANISNPTLAQFAANANRANSSDLARFRSLTSPSKRFETNVSWVKALGPQSNLSINLNHQQQDNRRLLGLAGGSFILPTNSPFSPFGTNVFVHRYFANARPLLRDTSIQTLNGASALNSHIGDWRWSLNADIGKISQNSRTTRNADLSSLNAAIAAGTANPFAADFGSGLMLNPPDTNNSRTTSINARNILSGTLIRLPAGDIQSTWTSGYSRQILNSESTRYGAATLNTLLSRSTLSQSASVEIPIFDRSSGGPGDVSLSGSIGVSDLSDFGTLVDFNVSLRWSPIKPISLSLSWIGDDGAPELTALGGPVQVTPGVLVFDYLTGNTVLVDVTSGGNPALRSETRRDIKAALSVNFAKPEGLSFQLEYFRNRSRNTSSALPLLTAAVESAFPERIRRDNSGNLIALDQRFVNYNAERSQRIRWGFNYSGGIGPQPQGNMRGGGGSRGGGGRIGGGGAGGPPGGGIGAMMGGAMGARWQIALYHSYRLQDEINIRAGLPLLDLLNGAATGSGGGNPRHEVELSGGLFYKGIGWRLEGNYRSATHVENGTTNSSGALYFGDRISLNSFLFINLDQRGALTKKFPMLKGSRIAIRVLNVLDDYIEVKDTKGLVPISYQRGLIEPVGRSIEVSFRKKF